MPDEKKILACFDKSVSKALALKKTLGHYAVVRVREGQRVKRIEAKYFPEYAYKGDA